MYRWLMTIKIKRIFSRLFIVRCGLSNNICQISITFSIRIFLPHGTMYTTFVNEYFSQKHEWHHCDLELQLAPPTQVVPGSRFKSQSDCSTWLFMINLVVHKSKKKSTASVLTTYLYFEPTKVRKIKNIDSQNTSLTQLNTKSVVDNSVGRALSFSHEGPRFKSRRGHLFLSLLICDLIDC
jgi:hypothetical protein